MVFWILFGLCITAGLVGAVLVVFLRRPFYNALSLSVTLIATAGLYYLMDAPFLAVLQILIYAGAILILFLAVAWLTGVYTVEEPLGRKGLTLIVSSTVFACFAMLLFLFLTFFTGTRNVPIPAAETSPVRTFAVTLFDRFVFPFELTSLLFIVAVVGVLYLVKKERKP